MPFTPSPADAASIATIRTLAADVVGKANSGHPGQYAFDLSPSRAHPAPGAPMGMAPVSHVLFTRYVSSIYCVCPTLTITSFFNANPKSSKWFNRDRFVLSNG